MADESRQETEDRDEELLRAVRAAPEGDLRAFEQLIELYQKRILADCRFLTRDENNSEDLAQEVFVKAFFALRTFEGRSTFRHWLQRIKVHHCLNHLKKRGGKDSLSIDDEVMEAHEKLQVPADAERKLEEEGQRQRIGEILNSLPATLRIPLVMCDMDELSYEEIAASLGIGLSAVKMRIKRARELFRFRYAVEEAAAAGRGKQ
ncbi:RNA polymerase sigma factor [Paludibaculum fermentans]|uniref:Sigma-70 family RNA polymerase sigma factor n=1 Tax=Paludibaculum fermentans TaxID=1473598 RepID=A0A7S7NVU3_PALFE|nr:sigma-70 family RNA polymerase sigma factor [Paludibaculum fermentans]QOY90752.1 sigma-70 family RNA polymerase sigma factor [Paludibaculum fermentans]